MHSPSCTNATKGEDFRDSKNLSYIPFPKPIRLNAPSTPRTGTIAKSILEILAKEFFGSLILNFFLNKGSLNFTILKLLPSINGT